MVWVNALIASPAILLIAFAVVAMLIFRVQQD